MSDLLQLTVAGTSVGAVYALIAIGFVAIFSVSGVINLAQGEFAALAGLLAINLHTSDVSLAAAVIIAVCVVGLIAMAIQQVTIAPLKNLTTLRSIILTLGVATVLRAAMLLIWGPDGRGLPPFPGGDIQTAGVVIRSQEVWLLAICLSVAAATIFFYDRTLMGKALRACAQQPDAARLAGISLRWAALVSFGIAGVTGAVAGVISSPIFFSAWDTGLVLGLKGFVAAALAGLTSIRGAVLGGLILGIIESYVAGYIDSGLRDAVAFVILIGVLVVRPTGLLTKSVGVRV